MRLQLALLLFSRARAQSAREKVAVGIAFGSRTESEKRKNNHSISLFSIICTAAIFIFLRIVARFFYIHIAYLFTRFFSFSFFLLFI